MITGRTELATVEENREDSNGLGHMRIGHDVEQLGRGGGEHGLGCCARQEMMSGLRTRQCLWLWWIENGSPAERNGEAEVRVHGVEQLGREVSGSFDRARWRGLFLMEEYTSSGLEARRCWCAQCDR
ncbi:hypothetical protein M0R45_016616 [Rubus argutus]|uniref:Uncharacterized protein n=1 Tax=Rubus argutus TaxID=59490 RepID=A0AAW1XU33_RUBAR